MYTGPEKGSLLKIITNDASEKLKCQHIKSAIKKNPACLTHTFTLGNSVLHLAIQAELPEVATLLIKKGCNINSKNERGETPLHLAISSLPKMAKSLIELKCKLNLKNKEGNTPLHVAVQNNSEDIVKLLINYNSSLISKNKKGETPLHLAANSPAILLVLSRQPEVKTKMNLVDKQKETPLHKAVRSGCVDSVKILVSQSACEVSITNINGHTAKDLLYSLELSNREALREAFQAQSINNGMMPAEYNDLFQPPAITINQDALEELQNTFKALKINHADFSEHQQIKQQSNNKVTFNALINHPNFLQDQQIKQPCIVLNEDDFSNGRLEIIESFLLQGGDPNSLVNEKALLLCAFIHKQPTIFLRLIKEGATLRKKNLIKVIESTILNDESGTYATFISNIRRQLFPITEIKINACRKKIKTESENLEEKIAKYRLSQWFYDQDITIMSKEQLNQLSIQNSESNKELNSCIKSLYDIFCGKIKGKTKIEGAVESAIRFFDKPYIDECLLGLLDQFNPNLILDALIALTNPDMFSTLETPKPPQLTTVQKHFCLYILKEVIVLNLEFRYKLNKEFPQKLKTYLEKNYDTELVYALFRLNTAVNQLKNNAICNSYLELGKLAFKYPSDPGDVRSITNLIKDIVEQDEQDNEQNIQRKLESHAPFLTIEIRTLSLQFLEACELKEFRQTVWEKAKKDRAINAPHITLFIKRLKALTAFVYLQIKNQSNEKNSLNAFILFLHAANNCLTLLKLSQKSEIGPDISSLVSITAGLRPYEKKYLPKVKKIDQNIADIYTQLEIINAPQENYGMIRKLLTGYHFSLPHFGTLLQDKTMLQEAIIFESGKAAKAGQDFFLDSKALSIIGKPYSSVHNFHHEGIVSFLPKNARSDLLLQLSKINPKLIKLEPPEMPEEATPSTQSTIEDNEDTSLLIKKDSTITFKYNRIKTIEEMGMEPTFKETSSIAKKKPSIASSMNIESEKKPTDLARHKSAKFKN